MMLRLGTRSSALARLQTAEAAAALRAAGVETEEVLVDTQGDKDRQTPLSTIGGQGVFVRAIEAELIEGRVDVAVHSAKDVPSQLLEGTLLAAYLPRADVRDVLVTRDGTPLVDLEARARVGTSSRRRAAQILAARDDLRVLDIRGNVDTRLRKLVEGQYDAVVLAAAGLQRLGRSDVPMEYLPINLMLPAPGQGAIALQARADDTTTCEALARCNDKATELTVRAERAFLGALGAGCTLPVAALAHLRQDTLTLIARVSDAAGTQRIQAQEDGPADDPERLGHRVAEALMQRGAKELLAALGSGA